MEKKTMGAFISALRRAAGMTQRELGEHLFVSDKTVSRWERDECTPDLSLIPLIADLFGITADELLRGERKSTHTADTAEKNEETTAREAQKGDRRFRALLERRYTRYQNLSVISLGLSLLGVIVAAIINLGFLRAHIGFWIATALMLGATVCQICFLGNARISVGDEDDETAWHRDAIAAHNSSCLLTTKNVCFTTFVLFAFCLPLATLVTDAHWGLGFDSWLLYGLAYAAVALIAAHSVWELVIRKKLTERGTLILSARAKEGYRHERRLLGRSLALLLACGLLTLIVSGIIQSLDVAKFSPSHTFETKEDFISFAESEQATDVVTSYKWLFWTVEVEQSIPIQQVPNYSVDISDDEKTDDHDEYLRREFYGRNGEVLFTYIARRDIARIGLSDTENGFPVRVYTAEQIRTGYNVQNNIVTMCILAYGAFGAITVAVYVKKLLGLRKKYC